MSGCQGPLNCAENFVINFGLHWLLQNTAKLTIVNRFFLVSKQGGAENIDGTKNTKRWCRCFETPSINKAKEYPNSNDMMGRFLPTEFVWVRHVNNSDNFDPRRRLGDKLKHSWRNPPKNSYEATAIWETNVKNSWRDPPKNLF